MGVSIVKTVSENELDGLIAKEFTIPSGYTRGTVESILKHIKDNFITKAEPDDSENEIDITIASVLDRLVQSGRVKVRIEPYKEKSCAAVLYF